MQAASRESYSVGREKLEAYVATAQSSEIAQTADQLLAVAGLLVNEPRLRRALSDPARAGKDRAELIRSLFGDKIGEAALELVAVLVAGRWSRATQLLDAVEGLGTEALLASVGQGGDLGDVEDELFRFGQIVGGSADLARTLGDQSVAVSRRTELVRELLDGKASPATIRLIELALAGFGGRGFEAGLTRLVELAAARRDRKVAYITTSVSLSDVDERRLRDKLAQMYGREISLKIEVDPKILGGIRVKVGSDLYDGTILRRLNETRNALAGRR